MRICKITQPQTTLQETIEKFINYKKARHIASKTLKDYEYNLSDFLQQSRNTTDYDILSCDIISYFSDIPSTSPARFNHPYQYINAFLNWAVKQEFIPKNPLIVQEIKKIKDEGNIKPASLDDVKILLNSWDKTTYSGIRNYTIILTMLDTVYEQVNLLG